MTEDNRVISMLSSEHLEKSGIHYIFLKEHVSQTGYIGKGA